MTANKLSLNSIFQDTSNDDFVICFDKDKLYTKKELKQAVYALYLYLIAKDNIKHIAVCTKNSFFFDIAFIACLYANKCPVLLGNFTNKSLIEDHEKYDLIIVDESLNEPLLKPYELIAASFIDDSITDHDKLSGISLDSQSKIILYTSGSTGVAKKIVKTLDNMEYETNLLKETFSLSNQDKNLRVLSTVPPYHMYGLTFRVFMPLLNLICFDAQLTHYTEELCKYKEDILLISSPAFIKRIDTSIKAPNIVKVFSAGAPLSYESAQAFYNWAKLAVTEIYGSTETNIMAYKLNSGHEKEFTPFASISFFKDTDNNYNLNSPMVNGDFKLDDKLSFDNLGHFVIEGRKDKIIKLEEKRISLTQIETLSKELEPIIDAVALPIEKRQRTFIGLVLQVDKEFYQVLNETVRHDFVKTLKAHLKEYLPNIAIPRYIRIVDSIKTNSMGKKLTSSLKELFND